MPWKTEGGSYARLFVANTTGPTVNSTDHGLGYPTATSYTDALGVPRILHAVSRPSPRGSGRIPEVLIRSDLSSIHPLPLQHSTMATDVPTNSSSTPPRSRTTSSNQLRTSGVQSQDTSSAQLILDEAVDQVLVRAKSPLGEGEALEVIGTLEKVSEKYLLRRVGVPNKRTIDFAATLPDRPVCEDEMFPGTREGLRGIWYPP